MGYPQGIFERLDWLTKKYKQLCCLIQGGTSGGCITHKDITWDELNAKNATGTLADCYYNVINRPNSGTDPLYVLAEGGRVDLDNEVVRTQPSTGSLCVDSEQKGFGCFNVYAQQTSYTVEYVPGVEVIEMYCEPQACINYTIGDTVTNVGGTSASGTIVYISFIDGKRCTIYVQVTSGTFDSNGTITNGTTQSAYEYVDRCIDASPLAVGTEVIGVPSNIPLDLGPRGTITAISGSTITITPTSGSWDGIVLFVVVDKENLCFYTLTAPIVSTSVQLNSETVCWNAESYLGSRVYLNTLMQASDGLVYGTLIFNYRPTCFAGFEKSGGQLFSLDPVTNKVTVLFIFDDPAAYGANPLCNVIEVAGELYGTCVGGGLYEGGTIWKWNIITKTFTKLYDIDNTSLDGQSPYGGLLNVGGVLYGTCEYGGANDVGTLFSYNIGTSTFTKEADFDDIEYIQYPQGTLVEVNPGELWGTSYNGGDNNNGTIFKYTISSGALEIVINLDDVPNSGPGSVGGASGGVHLGSDGNVYFNTQNGGYANGGTICKIKDVATTPLLGVLYELDYGGEGGYLDAVCPVYKDGWVYGVTNEEGGYRYGTIYKLNVSTGYFQTLYNFNGTVDGGNPYLGQLLVIGDELFGMTNENRCREFPWEHIDGPIGPRPRPSCSCGQIFKYNIAVDTYTNIHALNSQAQTSANIATDICASITNPDYVCHTVGNCVYIDGPAGENGYTLALKTVVTYDWCYDFDAIDACAPTVGDHLYTGSILIGTIQTVTITYPGPGGECGTMTVELADNNYFPQEVPYIINETGCRGVLKEVIGTSLSYSVVPFAGGTEPVNLPCYYNVPFDVITEYPLSQKLTKAEIDYLVVNNLLIPGTYYRIIDADFFLYGGTEIVIQAVAPDKFNDVGMGKFYVPKYNKEQTGYGIWYSGNAYDTGSTAIWGGLVWTNLTGNTGGTGSPYNLNYNDWSIPGRVKINISGISGTFSVGDFVYGIDYGAQGVITEVGTDYLIVMAPPSFFAYPIWDPSNTIYDDDSGAEATMDSVTLHTDYFSDLIYDVRWDEIKYDYANDFITYRKDNSGNTVEQQKWEYDDWAAGFYRNILGMQWGNDFDDNLYYGVGSNTVRGLGYVENINFIGGSFVNNVFTSASFYNNNYSPSFGIRIYNNIFTTSTVILAYFNSNCSFGNNTITNGSNIYYFNSNYYFENNNISGSFFEFSSTGALPSNIYYLSSNGVYMPDNISGATIIYQTYPRELTSRPDGVRLIKYVNNSNTQVITAVTT